ncbi:putative RNA methylase family UPF0020 [Tamaricihabitans halophyticus]|uniref:Putative RNA methylase family UPF0020 n=1 Tax=Tamaricihabitans halophyticus TaxID=1262583 RepID=A0A4R2QCQ9_9PSEU|nr:SAM-dependent methyltransferase [Tamaricihabitans halophyticus]TCP46747.1 putative RNA methylase family UPF0020 [Tamaricihabitans halophyticus]
MQKYAILVLPAANRVYTANSVQLMRAELAVFGGTVLEGTIENVAEETIGGVDYLTFHTGRLTERDVAYLSNLSSLYALFEVTEDALRPITVRRLDRYDSDLLTIQKYSGKTNELFTKLLFNTTALSTDRPAELLDKPLRVFDPMCGRGTTLNQAIMYGGDASGMDLATKDFEEYERFLRTWLKNKRIKHRATSGQIRRNKVTLGKHLEVEFAADKDAYKAGQTQHLRFVHADTTRCAEHFRPREFDLIVTDAPYGVQHGSRRAAGAAPARRPAELLAEAIPQWAELLRPGGAIGISWNTYVLRTDDLHQLLAAAGFEIRHAELDFAHRVDQAITRNLVLAHKPAS